MAHTPVVIIGAPRSGTNMLRDLLCSVDGVATWPCDEINYIWRHGNIRYPSDVFSPNMADARIRQYVRRQFSWVERKYGARIVVEKTCANSLRVEFVEKILSQAKYIFIYRDGIDVISSAMRRWKAKIDLPYLIYKARFVPPADLPYYAARYMSNRMRLLMSADGALSTWGPVLDDMKHLRSANGFAEICTLQWQQCVERSLDAFKDIPRDRVFRVAYEDLVLKKKEYAVRIAKFLNVAPNMLSNSPYITRIRGHSIGKGYENLPSNVIKRVLESISPTMKRLGYL